MALGDSTLGLNIGLPSFLGLPSFSPTPGYPSCDLDRHEWLAGAVQNCLHPFDHRLLQPGLCGRRLLRVALDNHLVVTDEYRLGPWTLFPTLPQKCQRQLQAIGSGSLDRTVDTVGQLLDVFTAPASSVAQSLNCS
jgi:hypothetical protein